MSSPVYLQYGCGLSAPAAWLNFDASPTVRLQQLPALGTIFRRLPSVAKFPSTVLYGDIVRGLPVPDASAQGVYCSHVLEHLSLSAFRVALRNTHRVLVPRGVFRIVMPDLEYLARRYLSAEANPRAAGAFMSDSGLGLETRPTGIVGFLRQWLGNSQHNWLWDFAATADELDAAGFREIRRAQFHDSADPRFAEVEDPGRWENCLGIESRA